jgi:hypothetical protein
MLKIVLQKVVFSKKSAKKSLKKDRTKNGIFEEDFVL